MSKYKFGSGSSRKLSTCHPVLAAIAARAIGYGVMDISVIEGHRSLPRQALLYRKGLTKIDGKNTLGKHNSIPALAMDLLPYPGEINGVNVWQDKQRFCVLAGLIFAAAAEEGASIRWGGDWDGDGNNADSGFTDYPHFELIIKE
ncbi:MAG: M15 family metallopeptidase [Bermanella sp.]